MNIKWNHTNLCLIPKPDQPLTMKDFRPISLCNVIYKIVSKILVKRLKAILSKVVSDNQAAFVPGRIITDNVLIAHEVLHSLQFRKRCAKSYMSVKTDISKAYDRIEWRFLEAVLIKKGFAPKWVQWIMECVCSVSFSVLINGSPFGNFEPTRGLRQGDPLSPSLYILCADVLSSLMSEAVREGRIQGICVSNRGPAVSHLLFADDSLFFLKADHKNSSNLLKIFKEYGEASGQIINFDKSSITFGSKVYQATRERIMNTLQIPKVGGGGKYLGLPEQFGRKKKEMLQYIHDQLRKRIEGWQTKFLSTAGKETLIKSVAYAMPVYSMNCFQLPMELCAEIDSLIARFWWGTTQEKKKISWIAWKKLVTSKKEGGLGFRDLHLFNKALLANQAWRIIQRPQSLIYRLLKARYFREGNFFTATRGTQPSYGWNSLRFGRELLESGIQRSIGDGKTTTLTDPWLPTSPPRPPQLLSTTDPTLTVDILFDKQSHQWDEQKLLQLVNQNDHHLIHKIFLPHQTATDTYLWSHTKDGIYTVKSGYWKAMNMSIDDEAPKAPLATNPEIATRIWKLNIVPKLRHFLWRYASKALGIAENLRRRNINVNPYCTRCCQALETNDHTFFTCPAIKPVWRAAGLPTQDIWNGNKTFEEKLHILLKLHDNSNIATVSRYLPIWLLWRIWKSRNDLIFNRKVIPTKDIVEKALSDTKDWLDHHHRTESRYMGEQQTTTRRSRLGKWRTPKTGWVKCNFDASHHEGDQPSGLGWIIRDPHGNVLDCGMGKYQGRHTIEEAKCTALIWAIQASWALGYRKVEFEGDNITIMRLINGTGTNLRLKHYLQTIRQWRGMFTAMEFKFQHREQNECADLLAKQAVLSPNNYYLYHCCPSFLNSHVNNDATIDF